MWTIRLGGQNYQLPKTDKVIIWYYLSDANRITFSLIVVSCVNLVGSSVEEFIVKSLNGTN